jgi:hypothetical protein
MAPTPVSVMKIAAIHAIGRPHGALRTSPKLATNPISPAKLDVPINVRSPTRRRPTAEGSWMNPKTNQAHHVVTTAPASSAAQSQVGVEAACAYATSPPALRATSPRSGEDTLPLTSPRPLRRSAPPPRGAGRIPCPSLRHVPSGAPRHLPAQRGGCWAHFGTRARNCSSSRTATFSFCARSSFEPAPGPATT